MKTLLTLIFAFVFVGVFAGGGPICEPDTTVTGTGITPDTLPKLFEGAFYDVVATVVIPTDTIIDTTLPPATINFFQLNGTGGLPTWVSVACEPPNCVFAGGTTNCVRVSGSPPCGSAGNYPLEFYITLSVTVMTPFGPQTLLFDDTISGYFLQVCPMAAPENVQSTEGCTNVTLSWDPVPGAIGYQVKGGPVGNINAATLDLTNTSITVNNLAAACYEWYVRAKCNATTFGDWSERDTFCLPKSCGSPAPISSTVFGPSFNNVTLMWTAVPGAIGYQIQGGPGPMSTAVSLNVSGGGVTSLTVNNLACGTYSWRIRAVCCLSPFSASPYTAFDQFGICPQGKTEMGGNGLSAEFNMDMYPNPATDVVQLTVAGGDQNEVLTVSVYDLSGKVLSSADHQRTGSFDQLSISTAEFANGIYQVIATNGTETVQQRLVISR